MSKLTYKTYQPMTHQREAMKAAWKHNSFALFMDMGTGKTYVAVNLAAARFLKDQIDALLVICPTSIKLVWEEELDLHCSVDYDVKVINGYKDFAGKKIGKWLSEPPDKLKVLIMGVEAFSQGKCFEIAATFAIRTNCMMVVDESTTIKNPKSTRTKKLVEIGKHAIYRMIMSGSPITQGMEDLYAQFQFLNEWIIGCKSYFLFKNKYCIIGGFQNKAIVGYQNKEDLIAKIEPYTYSVKITDCIDMPEKIFRQIVVEPTSQQLELIRDLKDMFEAEHDGDILTAATVLERVTRYQQIIGGFFPYNTDDPNKKYDIKPVSGKNPKLIAMMDDIATLGYDQKVIIWSRFRPEIKMIVEALQDKYGSQSVVQFHGGLDQEQKKVSINRFRTIPRVRFIVLLTQAGRMGLTLTEANYAYYYSNSFSFEDRDQSERRNWRKGQTGTCVYIDVISNHKYDKITLAAIKRKGGLAKYVEEQLRSGN